MYRWLFEKIEKQRQKYFKKKVPQKAPNHLPQDTLNALIAYNNFGGYCIPASSYHRPAAQAVLHGKVYEKQTIDFVKKNYVSGDIIHAGTYFGDFLPFLSKILSEDSVLWAFEPNKESFRCAQITIKINNLDNIELFNVGLASDNGIMNLITKTEDGTALGGGSSLSFGDDDTNAEKVKVDSLDKLIPNDRKVSILHLDVEGFEKQALSGASRILSQWKPILILEDNNQVIETEWFENKIAIMGYKIIDKIENNTILKAF